MEVVDQGSLETKEGKVPLGHLEVQVQWDLRDLLDFPEQLDCLEDQVLRVMLVLMVHPEYPVDTLASTSPSNLSILFTLYFPYIFISKCVTVC